jgi:hypothetical protein
MSDEVFDRIQFAIALLVLIAFFWWLGWFPRQMQKRRLRRWREWGRRNR